MKAFRALDGSVRPPVANIRRSNTLDRAICDIKDCFAKNVWGYPVYNGSKDQGMDMCKAAHVPDVRSRQPTKHRGDTGRDAKSLGLDPKLYTVVAWPEKLANIVASWYLGAVKSNQRASALLGLSAPAPSFTYENLLSHSYVGATPREIAISEREWSGLLDAYRIPHEKAALNECLRVVSTPRRRPSPHSQIVDNLDELRAALEAQEKLRKLRGSPLTGMIRDG